MKRSTTAYVCPVCGNRMAVEPATTGPVCAGSVFAGTVHEPMRMELGS